jgi:hypothetical protein
MSETPQQTPTTPAPPATPVQPPANASGAVDRTAPEKSAANVPTAAFLGIRLDERRRIATRDGFDGAKASLIDRPQLWELLVELVAAGDAPLERGELAAGCRKRVRKDGAGDDEGVLRSALTALRSRLKPLRIIPRSVRNVGVRLEDISKRRRAKPKKAHPTRSK